MIWAFISMHTRRNKAWINAVDRNSVRLSQLLDPDTNQSFVC